MANTNSIFYKIGAAVKDRLDASLNPYVSAADIQSTVTLGTTGEFLYTSGGSTLRIFGLDANKSYTSITITSTQAVGAPAVITFNSGALVIDTASDATVSSLQSAIKGFNSGTDFNAVLNGSGLDLVSANSVSPAQNFLPGQNVLARNNLTVSGDLTVKGTTTTVDSTTLTVTDNIINLSKGASGAAYSKDSGLFFERGTGLNPAFFIYDESTNKFVLGGETSGVATDDTLDAVASDAGRGTLQVGKVEVWNDDAVSPAWLEIGDLEDFQAGLG